MVLLVAATLLGQSLLALLRVETGFTAEQVATVRVALAGPDYRENARQTRFFEDLVADEERHYDQYTTELENLDKFGEKYLALQSIERSRTLAAGPAAGHPAAQ